MTRAVDQWLARLPALRAGEVAACIVSLRGYEERSLELTALLNEEEQRRAAMFRFEADRWRFIASHALLRSVVAQHVRSSPHNVTLSVRAFERPRITGIPSPSCISLSHAGELAAVAVARTGPVGIDVEPWQPLRRIAGLERAALTAEEAAALHYVAVESRGHAFLRCWCAKEAIAKALGTGLSTPLAEIAVGINAEGYASQRRYLHPASQQRFDLCHFDVGSEGCASIAVGELGDRFDITIGGIDDFFSWTFS